MAGKKKTRAARAENMKTVKVIVEVEQLGSFKKGDELDMHESTAAACEKNGTVKYKGKAPKK